MDFEIWGKGGLCPEMKHFMEVGIQIQEPQNLSPIVMANYIYQK